MKLPDEDPPSGDARIFVIAESSELAELCAGVLRDLGAPAARLIPSLRLPECAPAEVLLWDAGSGLVPERLSPSVLRQSVFVVDPEEVEDLRRRIGNERACILLKPVKAPALRLFLDRF